MNASNSLITIITNAIANNNTGFEVLDVREFDTHTTQTSYSMVSDGGDPPSLSLVGSTEDHDYKYVTLEMAFNNLSATANSIDPLEWSYQYVLLDNAYANSKIDIAGGTYSTTHANLQATMASLANTFLSNKAIEAETLLQANSIATIADIPHDTFQSIYDSLVDNEGQWKVLAEFAMPTTHHQFERMVVMVSDKYQINNVQTSLTYRSIRSPLNELKRGKLTVQQIDWRVTNTQLDTLILDMSAAHRAQRQQDIIRIFI